MGKYFKLLKETVKYMRQDLNKVRVTDVFTRRVVIVFSFMLALIALEPSAHFLGVAVASKALIALGII